MRKYKRENKRKHILSKLIFQTLGIFVIATISIVLYDMYININVENELYETEKISQEISTENTEDISTMLENVSKSVVRYFKNRSK